MAAGCGDGGGGGEAGEAGTGAAFDRSGPSFVDRLDLLPRSLADGGGPVQLQMADLDWAAELAGAERPADPSDPEATERYLLALQGKAGMGPEVAVPLSFEIARQGVSRSDEFRAEVGWSLVDVDWYVAYVWPAANLTVLGGRFAADQLAGAMGESEDGVWQLGDADAGLDIDRGTAARPMGGPLWLALAGEQLLLSDTAEAFEDARAGGPTMAEDPELRALAEAMDGEQVYSALFDVGGSYEPRGPVPEHHQLEPFLGVAVGLGHDGDQPYTVLAYAHDTAGAADANAEVIRALVAEGSSLQGEPWSDQFTMDEIGVDGTTVVARLALHGHPGTAYDVLQAEDTLAVHR